MLGVGVPAGAIFYWTTRRRHIVELTAGLREAVEQAVTAIRGQLRDQRLPEAPNDARCRHCSLQVSCLPSVVAERSRLRGLQGALFSSRAALPGGGDD
jgi:CRISPR-associated exonuclease Cas4